MGRCRTEFGVPHHRAVIYRGPTGGRSNGTRGGARMRVGGAHAAAPPGPSTRVPPNRLSNATHRRFGPGMDHEPGRMSTLTTQETVSTRHAERVSVGGPVDRRYFRTACARANSTPTTSGDCGRRGPDYRGESTHSAVGGAGYNAPHTGRSSGSCAGPGDWFPTWPGLFTRTEAQNLARVWDLEEAVGAGRPLCAPPHKSLLWCTVRISCTSRPGSHSGFACSSV